MERHALTSLSELLQFFPCVAVVGVRQCGKTTLTRMLPSQWQHFDLEKLSDFQAIVRDPDLFFRLHPDCCAIDECQLMPQLFPALRVAIDSNRQQPSRFLLTGSSSPNLLRAIAETLAGRVAFLELAPFTLAEAFAQPLSEFFSRVVARETAASMVELAPRVSVQDVHSYWLRGGYPEPWVRAAPRFTTLWQRNYVETYIQRDVPRLFPGLDRHKYSLFISLLANLSGEIINYANVARMLSVSQPTAREYFQIAHGTFLWRQVPSYERTVAKRIVKHPKGYLRDSGLLHHLLRLGDQNALLAHPAMEKSWEGMVIENILRGFDALGVSYSCSYYRTGGGAEVDLVLEGDFGLLPVEIKYTQAVSGRDLRSLREFMREYGCRLGIVVSNDERVRLLEKQVVGIPFACL